MLLPLSAVTAIRAQETRDSASRALQGRGAIYMGVDQYTSRHQFDDQDDGGRIELQRQVDDSAGVAQIRLHLRQVMAEFIQGNFTIPGLVHDRPVPGAAVMAERKHLIRYQFRELPRGGEIRIITSDARALAAIHEFLAFQRMDHRAAGHTHSP